MFAIDREIGIECQNGVPLVDLSHPYDARIGERHRPIPIFLVQLKQGGEVLLDVEGDRKRTIFEKSKQCILRSREAREQMHRLGQYRLTNEQRRVQLLKLFGNPAMMLLRAVGKSDRGPVSRMATGIAAKACEILGIGREVCNSRIHRSAGALHQPGQALTAARVARRFEHEPQAFLDQVL